MSTIVVGVAVAGIVAGGIKAFSGFKEKRAARRKQDKAEQGLKDAQGRMQAVDTSNPWVDAEGKSTATNAYAGLDNQMSGLKTFMTIRRTFMLAWKIRWRVRKIEWRV